MPNFFFVMKLLSKTSISPGGLLSKGQQRPPKGFLSCARTETNNVEARFDALVRLPEVAATTNVFVQELQKSHMTSYFGNGLDMLFW